jgi:hypothetical protein
VARHRAAGAALALAAVASLGACAAPASVRAPDAPRPITARESGAAAGAARRLALLLVEPFPLAATTAVPATIVIEAGEALVEQRLEAPDGATLTVRTAPDGALRLLARGGVPTGGPALGETALVARGLLHLRALGIGLPAGPPLIEVAGGRRVLLWERRVDGVPVEGDALRLVLSRSGALVGVSRPAPAPLAGAPAPMARADATAAGAAAQRLLGTGRVEGTPVLAWVAPGRGGGDEPLELPRRLAWVVAGTLGDGTPCALHLDAATLELIGWDWAP